jgi:hypothetical protein
LPVSAALFKTKLTRKSSVITFGDGHINAQSKNLALTLCHQGI